MSSLNGAAYVYPRSPFFWLNMFEYFARIIRARFVTESSSPPHGFTRDFGGMKEQSKRNINERAYLGLSLEELSLKK